MSTNQIGPDHVVADVIHVQIQRDPAASDAQKAFFAKINAPGFSQTLPIANGASKDYQLAGVQIGGAPVSPTVHVEVDNFRLLPAGSTAKNATAIAFLLVFRLEEIFKLTIGSIPVTASLK
ncbi:MAG: hypothetical protein ACXWNJ_04135 [Vulcanimicrobiaceae bacterium]